jgi:hypothetical protein
MPLGSFIPMSSSLLPGLAPKFWICAHELEETPRAGRRRTARFPVLVVLLPLLCWTRSWTTSIHRTCVIPRGRYLYGACLCRAALLHDLEVGFIGLH